MVRVLFLTNEKSLDREKSNVIKLKLNLNFL